MQVSEFISLLQESIWIMMLLSAPVLVGSMVVGVGISILQTITSIQEQTLTLVPKILIGLGILALMGSWMVETLMRHTRHLYDLLIQYGH